VRVASARRRRLVAGLDIGGTKTLAVAVDPVGAVQAEVRVPTDASDGDAGSTSAVEALELLAAELGQAVTSFEVVGVGIPGWVSPSRGTVTHAINLGVGREPVAVANRLARAAGVPTYVENDVNAAAVGAAALLQVDDLAYLSIGTGLAAGLLLDGVLRRGASGVAGEIGHLPLDPAGPRCECGQRGCLEVMASGRAIAARWPRCERPAADLFATAAAGDAEAIAIRDDVASHLAEAVVLLVLGTDPEVVVLGGGVAEVGTPLVDAVRAALERQVRRSPLLASLDVGERLRLVPDGASAGALGAAILARQRRGLGAEPRTAAAGAAG
jgi:predicted NBD/HSP70 family sugar kinase